MGDIRATNSPIIGSGVDGDFNHITDNSIRNAVDVKEGIQVGKKKTKPYGQLPIIVSSIALAFSFIAFFLSCLSVYVDARFFVSILLALTTILITWQVVNYFSFISDLKKDIDKKFEIFRSELYENKTKTEATFNNIKIEEAKLSTAVYSTIFQAEQRKTKESKDVYSYIKYGLLVVLHAESYGNIGLCKSMIDTIYRSLSLDDTLRIPEKVDVLKLADQINQTSIYLYFDKLYKKILVVKSHE